MSCRWKSGHVCAYYRKNILRGVFSNAWDLRKKAHKLLHILRQVIVYYRIYLVNLFVEVDDMLEADAYHLPLDRVKDSVQIICKLIRRSLEPR